MSEKKSTQPPNGDFIDLDKGQYKKNSGLKRFIMILSMLFIIAISIFSFFQYFNLKSFLIDNNKEDDLYKIETNKETSPNLIEKVIQDNEDKFNLIRSQIEDLNRMVLDYDLKLSEANKIISNIKRKTEILENRNENNLEFVIAEKYMTFNTLLSIKNKFVNRQDFKEELNNLIMRFNNQPEVSSLIIFFEGINISAIVKEEQLLERLNNKILFYEQDLEKFINFNSRETLGEKKNLFQSKEEFLIYLKNLFNSTFKITKIDKNSNLRSEQRFNNYNFLEVLKKSKEYLIMGNINKSLKIIQTSKIDDYELNKWIEDASILLNVKEKLNNLESLLLKTISNNVN